VLDVLVQRFASLRSWGVAAGFAAFIGVVAATTVVHAVGLVGLGAVAASPQQIMSGRLWLLITSGLLVQKPLALSLLSLAALGALALVACGWRVVTWAALLGHVCSTVTVYAMLALARIPSPALFAAVWSAPDYGVSAIAAAWLGAVASASWRQRGRSLADKAPVVLSCAAIAAFAWILRRNLNVLDSEHGVAFVLGTAVAWHRFDADDAPLIKLIRHRVGRRLVVGVAAVLVALAVASLAEAVHSHRPPPSPRWAFEL
jgi:hypothetical protein